MFVLSLAAILHLGCSPARQEMLVATVGNNDITIAEYENLFLKTSSSRDAGEQASQEEREKFLTLLTNFRLKLLDAYSQGLQSDPAILSEIGQYKGSLASSFLTERQVTRPGVRKLYEDRKTEYRASHILLTFPPNASSTDSVAQYDKARTLISRLKAGEDFTKLALENSQDPSVKQNKGDLYFFTAGQMTRPFEEAVMTMLPGEIHATPVRTQFGLHIIKLIEKKLSPGEIRCSHIMTRFSSPEPTPEDTLTAFEKIVAVRDSLALGRDFAEVAKMRSADPGSAPNGGDLGWFSRRRYVPEFEEMAFKLVPGQTSGIVRSRYGYHMIKCTDARPPKTFEESEKEMLQLYQQTRFEGDQQKLVERLKQETHFSMDKTILDRFVAALDTLKTMKDARWADSLSSELRRSTLMRIGQSSISVDSTVTLLKTRQDLLNTSLKHGPFRKAIDKIAEQVVFSAKAGTLVHDSPEFASLMKEYTDGILLYQVEQQKVWNSIAVTDSGLRAYYDANRDKFAFPQRVEFKEIRASNDAEARSFLEQAKSGKSFEEIAFADSLRMSRKNNHQIQFAKRSSALSDDVVSSLKMIAEDLKADPQLRVHLIAHPDTTGGKSANATLATKRLDRIKAHLKREHGVAETRMLTFTRPVMNSVTSPEERAAQNSRIDLDIIGRRVSVIGKVERVLSAIDADERSKRADSLDIGGFSKPFRFKNGIAIVQLLKREAPRPKTFEEAGTEVSSAFQEYESKRLERQWLDELRSKYPVTEYRENLGLAFPPSSKAKGSGDPVQGM
jgi:peptidyl-prolyl cis-trans isomerase SurA